MKKEQPSYDLDYLRAHSPEFTPAMLAAITHAHRLTSAVQWGQHAPEKMTDCNRIADTLKEWLDKWPESCSENNHSLYDLIDGMRIVHSMYDNLRKRKAWLLDQVEVEQIQEKWKEIGRQERSAE